MHYPAAASTIPLNNLAAFCYCMVGNPECQCGAVVMAVIMAVSVFAGDPVSNLGARSVLPGALALPPRATTSPTRRRRSVARTLCRLSVPICETLSESRHSAVSLGCKPSPSPTDLAEAAGPRPKAAGSRYHDEAIQDPDLTTTAVAEHGRPVKGGQANCCHFEPVPVSSKGSWVLRGPDPPKGSFMNFKIEHASQAPTSSFSPPLPNAPFDVVDFGARDFRLYPTQLTSSACRTMLGNAKCPARRDHHGSLSERSPTRLPSFLHLLHRHLLGRTRQNGASISHAREPIVRKQRPASQNALQQRAFASDIIATTTTNDPH
ncbi:hypothetical protein CCHR01_07243 [Colletotrichum chrysophilum]|uniref:Uncharacterized protein n=1 Tax=Colletotrichum chrysophilum TaxID=1836956 RepID=A0AAD9AM64_9PEZI|nr:hypothetical protein CCHR01_07243 [Colletotrichum chrysophilum]